MSNINSFIAKQVIDYRESMSWSQRELAEKMGIPHTSISRLESGEGGINSNTIEKFCKISGKRIEFVESSNKKVDDIVNYIIHYLDKKYGDYYDLTKLKLQKLLYYCQVKHLGDNYSPLFEHNIVHWEHGPVQKDVYYKFSNIAGNLIPQNTAPVSPILTKSEQLSVDYILELLGNKSAWDLRNMTHEETDGQTPWEKTKNDEIISTKLIVDYYKDSKFKFQTL